MVLIWPGLSDQDKPEAKILFLTARSMKEDKLTGFDIGAEDYVTKPFDEDELLCRIRVILRREQAPMEDAVFQIGHYFFDYSQQSLCYQGHTKRLTEKENEVLRLLCLHQNQILRREEAVEQIYGKTGLFPGAQL